MMMLARRVPVVVAAVVPVVAAVLGMVTACGEQPAAPLVPDISTGTSTVVIVSNDEVIPGAFYFTVSGPAVADAISWSGSGAGVQLATDTALPWQTVVLDDGSATSLLLQVDLEPGSTKTVTCEITRDGETVVSDTGTGGVLCQKMVLGN